MPDDFDANVADRFKVFDDVPVPDTWSRVQFKVLDHAEPPRLWPSRNGHSRRSVEGFVPIVVERRNDSARRRPRPHLIIAGTVAAAVVALLAGALVVATRNERIETIVPASPTDTTVSRRVGFIGLPPVGATPSTPESGEIVVSILSCYAPIGDPGAIDALLPLGALWVLADGRLIWLKFEDLAEGANSRSTGLLEQRLTPEGVELMRSEATAARNSGGAPPESCYDDERGYFVSDGGVIPGDGNTISADNEHLTRIIDPWSWLPTTAWEDPEIRAYVPSSYVVMYEAFGAGLNNPSSRQLAFAQLPAAAVDLVDLSTGWGGAGSWGGVDGKGRTVTTDEARSLAAALDDAGFERDGLLNAYRLDYQLDFHDETMDVVVHVRFYPMPPGCESWDLSCSPGGIGSLMRGLWRLCESWDQPCSLDR
jgi:hypothetical protein